MASQAYKTTDVELQDGTEVTVKPLPIFRLRRFMDEWEKFPEVKTENEGFTIFVNLSGISLEHAFEKDTERFPQGLAANASEKQKGLVLSKKYTEYLEQVLDIDTIYRILDVAGGLKLNDPKLLEQAATAIQTAQEEDGEN